ncbi:protein DPCD [Atheta coriaria]|uniref:protein DPCD n=1 Tax=Dalotia coriaria TaxID=877792 RepID=UPI0031F36463
MDASWFCRLEKAKKSAIKQGNLKKVHYAFENGQEMVEEYNEDTNCLTRRAWKVKNELGAASEWDIEIGDPEPAGLKSSNEFIKENSNQPIISRRITKTALEWRIRNLPYPADVFSVTADPDNKCLTVRTSNKKYFKKIVIPELERTGLLPEQENVSFTHKFNTLIITYKKPEKYLQLEKAVWTMVKNVEAKPSVGNPNDCRQS